MRTIPAYVNYVLICPDVAEQNKHDAITGQTGKWGVIEQPSTEMTVIASDFN